MSQIRYDGKVAVITGAGNGLGRLYALFLASRGAKVVVNDLGGGVRGQGADNSAAQNVVNEIKKAGGEAVANTDSVEFGEKIIQTALDNYGRVDIVINNAGILRDVAFQNMKEEDWDLIMKVHLKGAFSVTRAAWNVMKKQKYGRIVNTASGSGIYGNFGQSNYSAAKLGLHGFTLTLSKEGARNNILCNTIAPVAASRMTAETLPPEVAGNFKADYIVPLVAYLVSEQCEENGSLLEVAGGYIAKHRNQRSEGALFDPDFTVETVRDKWNDVISFERNNDYPTTQVDTFAKVQQNVERIQAKQSQQKSAQPAQQQQAQGQALQSDSIFTLIKTYLDRGEGEKLVKDINAIYQFDILAKKGGPVVKSFTVDISTGKGQAAFGKADKPSAVFTMVDGDFYQICLGKLNPQQAFMTGKMKIKGNMAKATKFTPELFPKPTPENLAKYGIAKL